MPYTAKIKVTLRQSILDVQGKAVEHALKNLGYGTVESARIGKEIKVKNDFGEEKSPLTNR